jgi:alkanesulfonate monooxygenase SsuD/methylene tetrahydromethanopterin reductase-like flavin-dependent oxidoreductase (luciferase family)
MGVPVIRDSRDEAKRVQASIFEGNGSARPWDDQPVGTPEDVVEHLAPIVELGYHHLIAGFPAPYDEETMTRLTTEVRPRLEAMIRA